MDDDGLRKASSNDKEDEGEYIDTTMTDTELS